MFLGYWWVTAIVRSLFVRTIWVRARAGFYFFALTSAAGPNVRTNLYAQFSLTYRLRQTKK